MLFKLVCERVARDLRPFSYAECLQILESPWTLCATLNKLSRLAHYPGSLEQSHPSNITDPPQFLTVGMKYLRLKRTKQPKT